MNKTKVKRHHSKLITPTTKALKAARILKGLSRKEAGKLCGWTPKVFEQIENGRSYISKERVSRILAAINYNERDFQKLEENPDHALALARDSGQKSRTLKQKPRRNFYRRITKESRIIRILRKRAGISQYQASDMCGYAGSIFGQIENGRIELPLARIEHIVASLEFQMSEYQALLKAEILRDELISECSERLHKLDNQRLASVRMVIISMGGT